MQKRVRFIIIFFSILILIITGAVLALMVNQTLFFRWLLAMREGVAHSGFLIGVIAVSGFLFLVSIFTLAYAILKGRLHKLQLKQNEKGTIVVGVNAIENIALNAVKLAQVGVKNAKATVYGLSNQTLKLVMNVVLYSDVEIQTQMSVLQDRVKKDVERYTGIPVSKVEVKVGRVELIGAKIEY